MKLVNGICVLAAVSLLAGCTGGFSPPEVLNRAQPVGSPYNKYLAQEYQDLANRATGADATYFANKGLAAVDGVFVPPVRLDGRDITGPEAQDMAEGRAEMIELLNEGGRDTAPDIAAIAQTRFDCWTTLKGGTILRRANPRFPGDKISCKDEFHQALAALKDALGVAPPPNMPSPPARDVTPATVAPVDEFPEPVVAGPSGGESEKREMAYLVFFDWNKHNISASAAEVLHTVSHEIKGRQDIKQIVVNGYTDTSGGEEYNMKLSMKRANAVKASLMEYGIPADKIRVVGHGDNDLLVQTNKGVREAQNRRAQITFE